MPVTITCLSTAPNSPSAVAVRRSDGIVVNVASASLTAIPSSCCMTSTLGPDKSGYTVGIRMAGVAPPLATAAMLSASMV